MSCFLKHLLPKYSLQFLASTLSKKANKQKIQQLYFDFVKTLASE